MYLLTFGFLIIAMLGMYERVLAMETLRIDQKQTTVGQLMIEWQQAEMGKAETGTFTLPPGYNAIDYSWNSIEFMSGGQNYVLTYASDGKGFSLSDLYQQVKLSGVSAIDFGYASSGNLITNASLPSGEIVSYPVPSSVPAGSFGIIAPVIH